MKEEVNNLFSLNNKHNPEEDMIDWNSVQLYAANIHHEGVVFSVRYEENNNNNMFLN